MVSRKDQGLESYDRTHLFSREQRKIDQEAFKKYKERILAHQNESFKAKIGLTKARKLRDNV